MKKLNIIRTSLVALATVFLFSLSWAAAQSSAIALESMPKHPDATGNVLIDRDHINIQVRGLKPDSVYTVWFVNMKPKKSEAGAGRPPYMFQTDKWGNGSYSAPLDESPIGRWASILVVLHPDGNPANMKKMVGALKAKL